MIDEQFLKDTAKAIQDIQTVCATGVAVDPIGPLNQIRTLVARLGHLMEQYTFIHNETLSKVVEHFHSDERITDTRIKAIEDIASVLGVRVGVLRAAEAEPEKPRFTLFNGVSVPPIHPHDEVEVITRAGAHITRAAHTFMWESQSRPSDIIAYRVVKSADIEA